MNGLSFAAPLYLWALAALPALWWLLRLTPPKPQYEIFPPMRLLAQISNTETSAAQSPWWLTVLRLTLAALLILAFAQPFYKAALPSISNGGIFVLMQDNSWAGAIEQHNRQDIAKQLITAAKAQNNLIYNLPTVQAENAANTPLDEKTIIRQINSSEQNYYALPANRAAAFTRLNKIIAENSHKPITIAYLTDGMAEPDDVKNITALQQNLAKAPQATLLWYKPAPVPFVGIKTAENGAKGLSFTLLRMKKTLDIALKIRLAAYNEKGQILGEETTVFPPYASEAQGLFKLPPDIRNTVATLRLEKLPGSTYPLHNAAALRLMNSSNKQKIVAILAQSQGQLAQPLLSPLYYVMTALKGAQGVAGGKPVLADSGTMEQNIDTLLAAKPALLIMGDTAIIPPTAKQKLRQWVEQGGTLFRLGGATLANSNNGPNNGNIVNEADDADDADDNFFAKNNDNYSVRQATDKDNIEDLLPVRLRRGERSFGGALSWKKPQAIAPFPPNSPFYGMAVPHNISIVKQILAEPSADLTDKIWISLTDGTPLMTAAPLGKGRLVLLHTEPSGNWSNLALSGFFVEMLQKLVKIADSNQHANTISDEPRNLAPYRIVNAAGDLEPPPDDIHALHIGKGTVLQPNFATPPGFYGTREALIPLNLLNKSSRFSPLQVPDIPNFHLTTYRAVKGMNLQKILFFTAACLFIADIIVSLILKSGFSLFGRGRFIPGFINILHRHKKNFLSFSIAAFLIVLLPFAGCPIARAASANRPANTTIHEELSAAALAGKMHLAYVITGNAELDSISQAGLKNLSRFIEQRTTIEPGDPVGINPATNELAFYPLIYWPIDADKPMPSQKAIEEIDSYMHHGGTVLFDTRDAISNSLNLDGLSANTARLRAILKGLNIPPLTPAPPENVIARSFYIMPDFPGRYRSSPLWIAANSDSGDNRPIRAGDGVSPILITANDFAAAWADNHKGGFLFPLIPDGEQQRLWSFRGGLNIIMYILTGNYKADQAHTPELLRRLK